MNPSSEVSGVVDAVAGREDGGLVENRCGDLCGLVLLMKRLKEIER